MIEALKMKLDNEYEGNLGQESLEVKSNFYWIQKSDKKLYQIDLRTQKETGKIEVYTK